ncbi:MAG: hypothetical protein JO041_11260 [Acidobacteria bacterium]|nr:hypothetical protein [Acidobacteriota bacterium]
MARGWESKSVEEQQSQAGTASSDRHNAKPAPEQAASRNREALNLACSRIRQQLEACSSERYAAQLRRALADLEGQLQSE